MNENNDNNDFIDYFADDTPDEESAKTDASEASESEAFESDTVSQALPENEDADGDVGAEEPQTDPADVPKRFAAAEQEIPEDMTDDGEYAPDEYDEYDKYDEGDGAVLIRIIIVLSSIALCALVLYFVSIQSGPVAGWRNYVVSLFKPDSSENPLAQPTFDPVTENSRTMPFEGAAEASYSKYRNGVLAAKQNYLCFLSEDNGTVWEKDTVIVNPILKSEGNYIMLADKGSRKLCLYNREKLIYSIETKNNIISANVSANGDVIVIEEKDYYKGAVVVYNRSGEEIFAWNSGSDTILSADISASSRRVAVSLLKADTKIISTVLMFSTKETESYFSSEFEDSVVFELNFTGETLNVTSDNRIAGISTHGRILWDITYEGLTPVHTATDESGNRLILIDDNNSAVIDYYSSSGKKRFTQKAADIPDYMDVNGTNFVYNAGRSVICGKINANEMHQFTASMDIHGLVVTDGGDVLIIYGNSLEFIKV